jgi:hypothetical protein
MLSYFAAKSLAKRQTKLELVFLASLCKAEPVPKGNSLPWTNALSYFAATSLTKRLNKLELWFLASFSILI